MKKINYSDDGGNEMRLMESTTVQSGSLVTVTTNGEGKEL